MQTLSCFALSGILSAVVLLTCPQLSHAQNLIVNGSFSAGYSGFTSGYVQIGHGGQTSPDDYSLVTNPHTDFYANANQDYDSFGDHTTGTGNMLFFDGSTTSGTPIWSQTVAVVPNSTYVFSVWTHEADGLSTPYPITQLYVNGVQTGTTMPFSSSATWVQYQETFNSGTSSNLSLSLVDTLTVALNNDGAVDDFSLTGPAGATAAPESADVVLVLLGGISLFSGCSRTLFARLGQHQTQLS